LVAISNRSIQLRSNEIANIKPVGVECSTLVKEVEIFSVSPMGSKA
jgi:hypothetical protein